VSTLLVVNTSSPVGALGLFRDGRLSSALVRPMPTTWLQELLPAVAHLLEGEGLCPQDLGQLAVVTGPGVWTGIRVGVATVKTLAFALGAPLVGVSALDALAYRVRYSERRVYAVIDAGRGRVYAASYRCAGALPEPHGDARLTTLDELLATVEAPALLLGDGVATRAEELRTALGAGVAVEASPLGELGLAQIARAALDRLAAQGPDDAEALTPLYLNE
jgi:tRNA threonylcarbamoyladenosine biosynthesis protein TsaB